MNSNPTDSLLSIANHIVTNHPEIRPVIEKVLLQKRSQGDILSLANVDQLFSAFTPKSGGIPTARAEATIDAINQTFPSLIKLVSVFESNPIQIEELETSFLRPDQQARTSRLESLLNQCGSDKAQTHAYHHFYANAFDNESIVMDVMEIGLGTNNIDVLSTMGPTGRPGASLRAFRDFFPNAEIIGCDVDCRILFEEHRITTKHVDQTKPETFDLIASDTRYDLMIDDGLHSPHANINSLTFFLKNIKLGGWAVVEDIGIEALQIWQVIDFLIPESYHCRLFKSRYTNSMLFAVRRNS